MNTALVIIVVLIIAYFVHVQLCKQGVDVVSEGIIVIKKPLIGAAAKLNAAANVVEGYTNPVGVLSRSPAFVIPGTLVRVSV